MAGGSITKELLRQINNPGPWSKTMRPLRWLIRLLFVFFLVALRLNTSSWITVMHGFFLGLAILSYLFTFFYLIFKNPKAIA